jgi:hypothetical protein
VEAERKVSGADGKRTRDKRVPALRLESDGVAGPAAPFDGKEALQADNERMGQELARITEQRDILKKLRASSPNHRTAVCPD